MRNIVPKDTRYVPFTQQRSCCLPASLSTVMYKLNIPLLPQELLGYHLGLIVSPENKKLFWNARTGKKPPAGYGTRAKLRKYSINTIFKKLEIPLKVIDHPVADFDMKSFVTFIDRSVRKNRDLLVCLNSGILNNKKDDNSGHICVVDRIYPLKKEVRIIDPSFKSPKWRVIKISKLKRAMELHPTKGGGFWELIKQPSVN